jgi:hypothetical protein
MRLGAVVAVAVVRLMGLPEVLVAAVGKMEVLPVLELLEIRHLQLHRKVMLAVTEVLLHLELVAAAVAAAVAAV